MFGRTPKVDTVKLNEAKNLILDELLRGDPESQEYSALLGNLERISALEKSEDKSMVPDVNTVLLVAGNLLGILIIVGYEHTHVVTSKATAFVLKSKT